MGPGNGPQQWVTWGRVSGACEALLVGSSASSLCTFLPTLSALRQASLRVTIPNRQAFEAGFPEFTRFYNHSFLWKLQSGVNFPVAFWPPVTHPYSRPLYQLSYRGTQHLVELFCYRRRPTILAHPAANSILF